MSTPEASGLAAPWGELEVMVVAGEASGELYGAHLVQALRQLAPELGFFGIGGRGMAAAGVELLYDADQISVVGLVEVASRARGLWRAWRTARAALLRRRPGLLVLIDFPDFNLRLAAVARKAGIPVLYFVSPQVWAWRSGRVRRIAQRVDKMLVILPFEVELYAREQLDVEFVGHPLVDLVPTGHDRAATRTELGLEPDGSLVTLLPGSRPKEVVRLLPEMLEAARRLTHGRARLRFALALAPSLERSFVDAFLARSAVDVQVLEGRLHELLAASDLAIVASGTATLEAALMLTPMIVVYRVHPLTYAAALTLTSVEHVSLVNLVAGRSLVPELLQGRCNAAAIAAEAARLLDDPAATAEVRRALVEIRGRLGQGGTFLRAARAALELLAPHRATPSVERVPCSTA